MKTTYCERGHTNCLDQNCGCVDNKYYRRRFREARERKGLSPVVIPVSDMKFADDEIKPFPTLLLLVCVLLGFGLFLWGISELIEFLKEKI